MPISRKPRSVTTADYLSATMATARLDELASVYAGHEGAKHTVQHFLAARDLMRLITRTTYAQDAAAYRAKALDHVAHALYLVRDKPSKT